jgi:hypothetical protein
MTGIRAVTCYGCEVWVYIHKSKIPKLQRMENRRLTMAGKYSGISNVNFLYAEFTVLKLDKLFQVLATSRYKGMNIQSSELRQSNVKSADQNSVKMHTKLGDILLQRN